MPVGPDVGRRQRKAACRLAGAELRKFAQSQRRGKFGAGHLARLLQDLDGHQARALLEFQPRRRRGGAARQHVGGADIGMARERDLPVHGEDAHLRVIGGVARRQHEGGLGIVELAGYGLHLRGRQPAGVQHYGQRIAAERAVGENIYGDIAPLHLKSPNSYPNCHTVIGRS